MGNLDIAIKDLQEKLVWYNMANMNSFKLYSEHIKSLNMAINVLKNVNGDIPELECDDSYERTKM